MNYIFKISFIFHLFLSLGVMYTRGVSKSFLYSVKSVSFNKTKLINYSGNKTLLQLELTPVFSIVYVVNGSQESHTKNM